MDGHTGVGCCPPSLTVFRRCWEGEHVRIRRHPRRSFRILSQNAERDQTQWWPHHLSGSFGEERRDEARLLEQKKLRQHKMAFKVVRFVAEYAFLFRKRLELTPLRTVPVGGMCLWPGTVTETVSLSEGMLREAGKILIARGAPLSLTDTVKAVSLTERIHRAVPSYCFPPLKSLWSAGLCVTATFITAGIV